MGSAVANGQVLLLNENEASSVHAHLRDLASTTQALARLYTLFIGKYQFPHLVSHTKNTMKFPSSVSYYFCLQVISLARITH